MNNSCAHCIAKHANKAVGYALSMHPKFADGIEVLKPMFAEINKIISGNLQYLVMGQICVDKNYRKNGIFSGLYDFMKQEHQTTFDNIITEVDAENVRSLNAHLAISFEILKEYGTNNKHWIIISLNCSDHLPDIT